MSRVIEMDQQSPETPLRRAQRLVERLEADVEELASIPPAVLSLVFHQIETPMGKGTQGAAAILREAMRSLEITRRGIEVQNPGTIRRY